ncbi:MAG: cardiolipin synthase [Anaerovoracaceae bacterium]
MKKRFWERNIISRFVFSRLLLTIILLLIQVALLIGIFLLLESYAKYILGGFTLLSAAVLIHIINSPINPAYKLAWILPVALVPVMGTLLYLFVQTNIGTTAPKVILEHVLAETKEFTKTKPEVTEALKEENSIVSEVASYMENIGEYPTYQNTAIEYHPSGEAAFDSMKKALEGAKDFIFMEYFIIAEGKMWDELLEILERKAKEGLEIRLMYDDLGCIALLPRTYLKTLKEKGIKAKAFAQLMPFLSTHYNNRDHRKITVIDGQVAFNGGINLADEYINEREVFGHWKDTSYKVLGDAVKSYTLMFLQLWNVSEKRGSENYARYINIDAARPSGDRGDGYVMPYGDGPHRVENTAENVYMDILNSSKKYVHIMSPYLILDNEMLQAILHGAKRGVEVKLLLPEIPDKWFANVIARSYYPEMIEAGVKIYQYTPGFVHAKMFVADDEVAVVGTINLDFRSLYLHYECAGFFYKNPVVHDIKKDFDETFAQSRQMTLEDYKNISWFNRTSGRVLRIISPLL